MWGCEGRAVWNALKHAQIPGACVSVAPSKATRAAAPMLPLRPIQRVASPLAPASRPRAMLNAQTLSYWTILP